MKDEMNSMASNGVWNLVELPNGAKAIGCKWVFKTKKDSLGNIERYKARLVAKGFTQNEGIDYKETFSPVSKKDSLRVIMTLVAHFDLELQQMDVKMTFLNGNLEEEVYMKQPEGFSSSGGEHLKVNGSKICFLVLYVDDILLATNDKGLLHEGDRFNLDQCLKNDLEWEQMKNIPYASAVGSLMYRPLESCKEGDEVPSGDQNYMLMYRRTDSLEVIGYFDSDYAGCIDSQNQLQICLYASRWSCFWRNAKQTLIATSTMEAEFVSCFEASSHGVWLGH
ncbi:Retrovirus-related Pol polyprotein from transposon TNT 1-94 [Vitis vinifera]|uniref:Retrovirus-related Pol polyprotein from transposon TNT 1-94 n=1 Tax=Vitis vinifera TaxID=29760 RepID=A0A438CJM8_VITVI|nr:Retrovirus-related Pol polyprotein from transposon TNT 1-94 [Vitis vinifera]